MKLLASLGLLVVSLFLAGCATPASAPAPDPTEGDTGLMDFNGTWQPQLLYLLATPHPRLYVEVAAVAGCAPSDETLDKLREFLTTYCEKPAGIEIVRSQMISRRAARGMPPRALAREYMNGPPAGTGATPAFLYVLYYDSALSKEALPTAPGQPVGPVPSHAFDQHPHSDLLPYPTIYMNVRYGFEKSVPDEMLLHEVGHLLGLVSRKEYAAGHHCLDPNCLMNRTLRISLSRTFMGLHPTRQNQLCGRCMQELVDSLKLPPVKNLRYAGPVLVRSEDGYEVLALPNRVKVLLGDLTPEDCQTFAAAVKAEPPRPDDQELRILCTVKPDLLQDPARLRETIQRAQADPLACVRTVVTRLREKWDQPHYSPVDMAANDGAGNLKARVDSWDW
jgi:hypothetical protein